MRLKNKKKCRNLIINILVNVNYNDYIGNVEFSSGKHYWEIKIDKASNKNDIIWMGITNN